MRNHGPAALLAVLITCGVDAPRVARAAVTLEAVGPATPAVIEHALVIHDSSKKLEHLIQDFTFSSSMPQVGMLVPVPAKPTVSKLASSPFAKLQAASTAAAAATEGGSGFGSSGPEGLTSGPKPEPIAAEEGEQVGRLATSVIAANDTKALKQWLAASKLGTDAATDAWLAGYAARGFYFVAVRVSPTPKKDAFKTVTETLQISFASALPYYPYAEASDDSNLRVLSVWLLSSHRYVPVSLCSWDGKPQWVRPWHENAAWRASPQDLKALLPKSLLGLLPPGPEKNQGLVRYPEAQLQHFEDQKSARRGYGDIVLVDEAMASPPVADLRRFMNVLDPEVKP